MIENVGLIVDDNPISRCYINILKTKKIKFKNVVYLSTNTFFFKKFFAKRNYEIKNFYPIQFLKNSSILNIVNKCEEFFDFDSGFCKSMYNFNNIFDITDKVIFANSNSINNPKVLKLLNKLNRTTFFNTGKQILKGVLNTKHKFVHIHPGYLPMVKGADGSLWHIKNFNFLGVSSFFMSNNIDEGKIIYREKIKIPNFNSAIEINKFNNIKEVYRIWFSFFDPLLRGYHFKKLLSKSFDFESFVFQTGATEEENYYSFMEDNDLSIVFKKVFDK